MIEEDISINPWPLRAPGWTSILCVVLMCRLTCQRQKTTCGSIVFSFYYVVSGIELRSSGLAAGPFLAEQSHQLGSKIFTQRIFLPV